MDEDLTNIYIFILVYSYLAPSNSKVSYSSMFMSPNEFTEKSKQYPSHSESIVLNQNRRPSGDNKSRHNKKTPGMNYLQKRKTDEFERMQALVLDKNWEICTMTNI